MILVACFARETRGNTPYLKLTGPAPLRFSVALATPVTFALPESLADHHVATKSIATNSIVTTSIDTNAVTVNAATNSLASETPTDLGPNSQSGSPSTPAASDMLVVSPQMLTEFFKPVAEGTNAVGTVVVPVGVPIGFTPPSAKPSSRATYHSP